MRQVLAARPELRHCQPHMPRSDAAGLEHHRRLAGIREVSAALVGDRRERGRAGIIGNIQAKPHREAVALDPAARCRIIVKLRLQDYAVDLAHRAEIHLHPLHIGLLLGFRRETQRSGRRIFARPDPSGVPFTQSGRERSRLAPIRSLPLGVPNAHLPLVSRAGDERPASILRVC